MQNQTPCEAVCFGELLVDMVSEAPDVSLQETSGFLKAPGGAPANVAAGLSRLGTLSRFVGQVGDDPFGHWLCGVLQSELVDIRYLICSSQVRTTLAFVATRSNGRKDVCFYRNPGADAEYKCADLDFRMFDGARLFHCGGVSLSQSPCREALLQAAYEAKQRGILVTYDPNWRPSLWEDHDSAREVLRSQFALADVVKVAEEEWEFLTGTPDLEAGASNIRAMGPRLVVVTLGEKGAYFNCAASQGQVAGFPTNAIDTLGAGDSFMAGLLHQVLSHATLEDLLTETNLNQSLRFANACGALATQKAGAIPSLPTKKEVARFLLAHN